LHRAARDLGDLSAANDRAGEIIANAGRISAPRLTGRLAASVRAQRTRGAAVVVAGNAVVPYAGVIHNGWRAHNIHPQPWLADTLDATQPQWSPAYDENVAKILDRVKGI
jgi:hypothetical protein